MTWASLLIEFLFFDVYWMVSTVLNHHYRTRAAEQLALTNQALAPGENTVVP